MSAIYRGVISVADKFVPAKLLPFWNHPAGTLKKKKKKENCAHEISKISVARCSCGLCYCLKFVRVQAKF